jgi:hypothetical protein
MPNLALPGRGVKVWNRRIFLVAASFGEGLLTERRTAAQPWRCELAFLPHSRPSTHSGFEPLAASAQPSSRAESAMVGLTGRNKLKAISGMPHSIA